MKKKAVQQARLVWPSDDGADIRMSLIDYQVKLQRLYHSMANSDSPTLREDGTRLLKEAAEAAAAKQLADLQSAANAKKPRPAARSPKKTNIREAMRPYKANQTRFKVFMEAWEKEALNGLRLRANGDDYTVDNENESKEPAPYTWGTLEKIYHQKD